MVVVAALAVPAFRSTLKYERLRKAAEAIRADWTRTQTRAMMTGETQVWVCLLATGGYSVSPYTSDYGVAGATAADVTNRVSSATGLTPTQTSADNGNFGQTMPAGVTIHEVLVSEADSVITMTQTSNAGEDGMVTIFFYPDGSSSSGRITVKNEDGRAIAVVLNGVAGTVRVMPVEEASR
jgi:Tfp pilus assembly protein FimT